MKRLLHTAFALALLLAASCSRIPEVAVDYIRKPVAVGSGETIFSWQFDDQRYGYGCKIQSGSGSLLEGQCQPIADGV